MANAHKHDDDFNMKCPDAYVKEKSSERSSFSGKCEVLRIHVRGLLSRVSALELEVTPVTRDELEWRKMELKEMNLNCCGLTTLPEELFTLRSLELLILRYNRGLTTLSSGIGQLQDLKELYLEGCGFTTLPEELFTLQSLEVDSMKHVVVADIRQLPGAELRKQVVAVATQEVTLPEPHQVILDGRGTKS